MDIRRVMLVARRELSTRFRQRSYRLTMLFQVIVVMVVACLPVVIAAFADDGPSTSTILVYDAEGTSLAIQMEPYVLSAAPESNAVKLVTTTGTAEEASQLVRDGDADGALIATRDEQQNLEFTFVNSEGQVDSLSQQMYAGAAAVSLEDRLTRGGVDSATVQAAIVSPAFALVPANLYGKTDDEITGLQIAFSYFLTILMFMAIMLYGNWVAQGVVEEKSSRIMEIMINAATPRDLLAGKVLGIGAAGLFQLLPMLIVGGVLFGLQRPIARLFNISTSSLPNLDFGAVSVTAIGWFLMYFLLGFTLYAAMYAGLGSLVSRQEEVNQAISPMQTISIFAYVSAILMIFTPDSLLSQILSIFPLTSPFVMVSRVIVGNPPAWELALSVGLLALTTLGAILLSARLYRVGVLLYGQKPSLKAVLSNEVSGSTR